jgi:hypothetical protein
VSLDIDQFILMRMCEKQPGFFEAFANRRNPVTKTTLPDAQPFAGFCIVNTASKCSEFRRGIGRVDSAARKHMSTTGKLGKMCAFGKQDFHPVRCITHEDQRRRGPRRNCVFTHSGPTALRLSNRKSTQNKSNPENRSL